MTVPSMGDSISEGSVASLEKKPGAFVLHLHSMASLFSEAGHQASLMPHTFRSDRDSPDLKLTEM